MKTRLFTPFAFLVSIAVVTLLVSGKAQITVAQSQSVSFAPPAPAVDQSRVSAALRSAPVMFIENAGQLDAGGGNGLIFPGGGI